MKKSKFKSHLNEALQTYLIEDYIKMKESKKSLFEKSISNNRFGVLVEEEEEVPMDDAGDEDMGFEDDVDMEGDVGGEEETPAEIVTDKPYPDLAWLAWQALITDPSTLEGDELYKQIKRVMANADGPMAIANTDAERVSTGLKVFTQLERIFQRNRV